MAVIQSEPDNIVAFLDAIAYTEGTDNNRQPSNPYYIPNDPSNPHYGNGYPSGSKPHYGYDVIVGGSLMPAYPDPNNPNIVVTDYSRHPNRLIRLNPKLSSTAAGRYQILYRYWKHYQKQLGLPDFSPLSQDRYAIQQLKEQRAYGRIIAGEFEKAVLACNNIWASLPLSPYGQHTYSMEEMKAVYIMKGGRYV
ncbi:MAG: glycoside hydrolase family 104 protein [Acholeplasmataceae bacterium]|nr:glycoside hydrolase family 104 protein [Acholeplasmataceae bacterium]